MKKLLLVALIPLTLVACGKTPQQIADQARDTCLAMNLPDAEYFQCKIRVAERLSK